MSFCEIQDAHCELSDSYKRQQSGELQVNLNLAGIKVLSSST